MLGPLPPLHRSAVVAVTLLTLVAVASWLTHVTQVEVAAAVGTFVGIPLALLLVTPPDRDLRPVRVRRR